MSVLGPAHTCKQRFHSENESNIFRRHYAEGIEKCNHYRSFGKSREYSDVIEKLRFQNVLRPQKNKKPACSNSSSLRSVFEKLRFFDRILRTVGLTVDFSGIMWRFP